MKNTVWIILLMCFSTFISVAQQNIYVATNGDDGLEGSIEKPVKTLDAALELAKKSVAKDINIYFNRGTYYLDKVVVVHASDFQGKKLHIASLNNEKAVISGGKKLSLDWKKGKKGIYEAAVEEVFDQFFVNGEKRVLARYPNYQEDVIFNGFSDDALSAQRIRRWKNPAGGFIHAMHSGQWGSQSYEITGKKKESISYAGGFQNNRPSPMHPTYRFVENIKEELDAPGEWFLDKAEKKVYYLPLADEMIADATIEVSLLPHLIELRGTTTTTLLENITIRGLCFTHTLRTFMYPYEQLMRSDWCIYRGAAVFLENTSDCYIQECEFKDLGGNAIFVSRYNLNTRIESNHIHHIGSSAVCLVGDTSAVRSGSLTYGLFVRYEEMNTTPGPRNSYYPRQCYVEDNLIHDIGRVEKQVAGVQIQIASEIGVRHNTIYRVPRAAINIGDGAFGGHIIEYNDAFETVLETSDHGAFNSWGRDRFWHPNYNKMTELVQQYPELILLDALTATVIRNNRFRCDHGWDIDLDDGSSNYHLYNNLCLRGGIKLREGFYRTVENNITINNSLHPHVWFPNSGDVIQRNIFMQPYFPIALNGWGKMVDYNFFSTPKALSAVCQDGTDKHSISGKIRFLNPTAGDFTVLPESEAFVVGFENFPMDRFGVYSPSLKAKARKPLIPAIIIIDVTDSQKEYEWLDATIRNVDGLGDRSAYGLPDESGVIVTDVKGDGVLTKAGIQKNDVIRSLEGKPVATIEDVFTIWEQERWKGSIKIAIFREQREQEKLIRL